MRGPRSQLLLIFGLMTGLLFAGTFGFRVIEEWRFLDAFYMTLITLTTVGYGEVLPLSDAGRVFNIFLMMAGVTTIFASIGILTEMVIKLELADFFGRRRRMKMLRKLSNHYIVCGADRVGRGVVNELRRSGAKVLVVENSPTRCSWASDQDIPTLQADATRDETLKEAQVESARGLVSAMATDADNVYVALSARVLNPDLLISARASDEEAEEKLRRAGATTVFTPYTFIGHRLAQSMLRPHVLSFLDIASAFSGHSHLDIEVEEIRVSDSNPVTSATLEESRIRQAYDVIVLAMRKGDDDMIFNPDGATRIEAGDVLIAMGERSKLKQMEKKLEA